MTIYYQKDDTVARLTIEVLSILKLPRDEWATLYLSVIDSNGLQVELPDDMLIDSIPEDMKPVMVVRKVPVAE